MNAQGCSCSQISCDDGNPCTADECLNGECIHTPVAVDSDGILHVPGEYPTIQAAICAARPGEQVVVADGVWTGAGNKDLDFGGKAITMRSASGDPAACIIDCQSSGRGFYFHNGETAAAVVEGFTIRNGLVNESSPPVLWYGGDLYCLSSSPTVTNCEFTGNSAGAGGGLRFDNSNALLTNCRISENSGGLGRRCIMHQFQADAD